MVQINEGNSFVNICIMRENCGDTVRSHIPDLSSSSGHNRRPSCKRVLAMNTHFYLPAYFYIVTLGYTGVYWGIQFFLFFIQIIDCGYSLVTCAHDLCFEHKEKHINFLNDFFFIFFLFVQLKEIQCIAW